MTRAADLKIDPVLALEQDLAIVEAREVCINRNAWIRCSGSSPAARAALSRSVLVGAVNDVIILNKP